MPKTYKRRSPADRFWPKVQASVDGCWLWTGARSGNGYGVFHWDDRSGPAHRFAYELVHGPIPAGMVIDHLCRNRACVRPDHMEVVRQRTNVLRGLSPVAANASKTHCKRGHPLSGNNLHITPEGRRRCRRCGALKTQQYEQRERDRGAK